MCVVGLLLIPLGAAAVAKKPNGKGHAAKRVGHGNGAKANGNGRGKGRQSETPVAGYLLARTEGDCSGTIALGEHRTCTLFNDDLAP